MAMLASDSICESMECSVCTELFKDPKQLLCGHTLCGDCVVRLVEHARNTTGLGGGYTRNNHYSHVIINCPECRNSTAVPPAGLPTNYKLADIGTVSAGKQRKCQFCDGKVAVDKLWHCATCSKYDKMEMNAMCSDCGVERHNGHELLKVATHMAVRRDKALEKIGEFRDQIAEQVNQISRKNMQLLDLQNSLYESMDTACGTKMDQVTTQMNERDFCSSDYLKKTVDEMGKLTLNSQLVFNKIQQQQDNCIEKLQEVCNYALNIFSSISNDTIATSSDQLNCFGFAPMSPFVGQSPAAKQAKNRDITQHASSTVSLRSSSSDIIDMVSFNSSNHQDHQLDHPDDIASLVETTIANVGPSSAFFDEDDIMNRPLTQRLLSRNKAIAKRRQKQQNKKQN